MIIALWSTAVVENKPSESAMEDCKYYAILNISNLQSRALITTI